MNPCQNELGLISEYLNKYPYRKDCLSSELGSRFILQIAKYESQDSHGYWERFGYEIAGPVCYAYVKWISDILDSKYPDVIDIAFIARDGYLLKKIYEWLPHQIERKLHYIYAPRSVCKACEEMSDYGDYTEYLRGQGLGSGTIAVVDSVTMRFSAQKLICATMEQEVIGLYWVVLEEALSGGKELNFQTFQKERYHTISAWNIIEFIMTSPELPVKILEQGMPVYYPKNEFETTRVEIFEEMSTGVFAFLNDMQRVETKLPVVPVTFIIDWINGFLANPTQEDVVAFKQVMFSTEADHSDCIPLTPFVANNYFWAFSQRYPSIYRVLRKVKKFLKLFLKKL